MELETTTLYEPFAIDPELMLFRINGHFKQTKAKEENIYITLLSVVNSDSQSGLCFAMFGISLRTGREKTIPCMAMSTARTSEMPNMVDSEVCEWYWLKRISTDRDTSLKV